MFETYAVFVLAIGFVCLLLGYVWLLLRAARLSAWWVVALIVFPPSALVLVLRRFAQVQGPAVLLVFGAVVLTTVFGVNVFLTHHLDLGPRERIVDGQLHITLTGWDKTADDYAVLAAKTEAVVLQMANPDVTDNTLEYLEGYQFLEELDVNDSQITDAGLARLAALPRLRVLRVRGTRITDEGFRTHLLDQETLQEVDVRDTAVASKTMREWKNQRSEVRRYLK
jgi:hypothetical protein